MPELHISCTQGRVVIELAFRWCARIPVKSETR